MEKVIHFFPAYKLGGAPICVLRFIESTRFKYEHSAIAKSEDQALFLAFQNASAGECYNVNLTKVTLINILKVLNIVFKTKPDIVHVHGKGGAIYGFIIAILYLKKFKLFYTFHGFYKKWKGIKWFLYLIFERLFSKIYDKSIAVSNSELNYIIKSLKISKKNVIVLPNAVYVSTIDLPSEIKNKILLHDCNIITLSRFSHQKDLETMIISFLEIKNKHSIALHIFGGYLSSDKSYHEKILKLIKENNLQDSVFIWGEYNNASSFIKHFDIYWSTALFEGLPTAIIEAFLNKTLVVGSNCRGNVDLIFDGKTGYLTEMANIKSNIKVIEEVIGTLNSDSTKQIIQNAYEVGHNYSIECYIKNVDLLYSGKI